MSLATLPIYIPPPWSGCTVVTWPPVPFVSSARLQTWSLYVPPADHLGPCRYRPVTTVYAIQLSPAPYPITAGPSSGHSPVSRTYSRPRQRNTLGLITASRTSLLRPGEYCLLPTSVLFTPLSVQNLVFLMCPTPSSATCRARATEHSTERPALPPSTHHKRCLHVGRPPSQALSPSSSVFSPRAAACCHRTRAPRTRCRAPRRCACVGY